MQAHAKTLPKSSPAFGIPTGNTVDDDSGTTIECGTTYGTDANFPRSGSQADGKHDCVTQLPDFDIAFHTIVAFREIADVFARVPGANRTEEAKALLQEADDLRDDVLTAMQRSKVSGEDKLVNGRNISCIPCHPGWISCKNPAAHPHFSKPTADIMCGAVAASQEARAVLPPAMFQDIYDYSYDPTAVQSRVDSWVRPKNTQCLLRCHFILTMMMILPRQARDKHRESTQAERCVFRRRAATTVYHRTMLKAS